MHQSIDTQIYIAIEAMTFNRKFIIKEQQDAKLYNYVAHIFHIFH